MHQIKSFIFREENGEVTVIMQDGGIASAYHNGDHICVDLYQSRLYKDQSYSSLWADLAQGEMYFTAYDGESARLVNHKVTEDVIKDMQEWLFTATEHVEYVNIEMGSLTEQSFNSVLNQLSTL